VGWRGLAAPSRGEGGFKNRPLRQRPLRAVVERAEAWQSPRHSASGWFRAADEYRQDAGRDPNGPTVPSPGGKLDIARLRRALALLKGRFPDAQDSCLVPSYGTQLPSIARALSGYYRGNGKRIFDGLCLVYPPAGRAPAAPAPR